MTAWCLRALLSHWWRNPVQLFAYLAGLALATALWSGVQAINSEARVSYDAAAKTLGEGQYDLLISKQGNRIPQDVYVLLRRSGWLVSPVIEERINNVRLLGIDPVTSPTGSTGFSKRPSASNYDTLLANEETGAKISMLANVTVDKSIAAGIAIGDIGLVQRMLKRDDLSRLILLPNQPITQPSLSMVAPNLRVQSAHTVTNVTELTGSFHLNLTAFGLLSFAVGLFIVNSTIGLAFEQRRGMIRTIRSLGVPMRILITLITFEMMTLAVIGAGFGIILGYFIAAFLLPDVAATLKGLYGAQISGSLELRASWWVSGMVLALIGTAVALSSRIWQIIQMPLLTSAKPRAWVIATRSRSRLQLITAITLLFSTVPLALTLEGLLVGFILLGCLLIGAALALPLLLGGILTLVQKYTVTPVWEWFWADTRQQLPGLSLALIALLLAVSANIGVSTMVSSFRQTFIAFLDQRLAPELFVEVETASQSAELEVFLKNRQIEVLPLLTTQVVIADLPVDLYGIRVGQTYRNNWIFLDNTLNAWDVIGRGKAVVVNEQFARRADLWVGSLVQVNPDLALPIAGVVGDYGNPKGQVIITERMFKD